MRLTPVVITAALAGLILTATWALAGGSGQGSSVTVKRPGPGAVCTGVALTPGSRVQAVISGAPAGTTFCFGRGVYRVSSLVPKSGDVLDGGGQAAVLD